MNEVVLPRRVLKQPDPLLCKIGDCGACVLGGIMDIPAQEIYDTFNPGPKHFSYWDMRRSLHQAEAIGLLDRICTEPPYWPSYEATRQWGSPGWEQGYYWFNWIRMAMDAGYYAIAAVDMEKRGAEHNHINHWILLCGARTIKKGNAIETEVLVSCSAKTTVDEEWVDIFEFLKKRGGFNCFLARPVAM